MKKFFILVLFSLSSCSANLNNNDFNFSEQMTIEEFRIKLQEYAIKKPYPTLNE